MEEMGQNRVLKMSWCVWCLPAELRGGGGTESGPGVAAVTVQTLSIWWT